MCFIYKLLVRVPDYRRKVINPKETPLRLGNSVGRVRRASLEVRVTSSHGFPLILHLALNTNNRHFDMPTAFGISRMFRIILCDSKNIWAGF